jgi:hypothetical protein
MVSDRAVGVTMCRTATESFARSFTKRTRPAVPNSVMKFKLKHLSKVRFQIRIGRKGSGAFGEAIASGEKEQR